MSVVTRCGAVSLVVGLLVGVAPALAQTAPADTSGSSWSDPPVRGSASPEAPGAVKPAESKPGVAPPVAAGTSTPPEAGKPAQTAVAPPATPAQRAAATLGVNPVQAGQRTASATSTTRARQPAVRPRMVERPLVIARRPGRIVERPSSRLVQRMSRRPRSYAFAPESQSYGRVDPYDGRSYEFPGSSRRSAGWDGLIDGNRADRIGRAREAGYSVMRMRTYAYPDGTQVQQLTPFGDLD